MYGRQPPTPIDNLMETPETFHKGITEEEIINDFIRLKEKFIKLQQIALSNISKAQESQLQMANRRILERFAHIRVFPPSEYQFDVT